MTNPGSIVVKTTIEPLSPQRIRKNSRGKGHKVARIPRDPDHRELQQSAKIDMESVLLKLYEQPRQKNEKIKLLGEQLA